MADEKPGEDEALRIALSVLPDRWTGQSTREDLAQAIREYGERERAEVARSCVDRTAYGREVAALQEKRQQAEAAVEMWKRAAFESGEKLRETEALTTRRGQEREKAEAALEAALDFLRKAAYRGKEIVSTGQLTELQIANHRAAGLMYVEPGGGLGWVVRERRVLEMVEDERDSLRAALEVERGKVKELYEAGIAAKTELAAERALSAHRLTRIEEESKGWAAEREAHVRLKEKMGEK